MPKVSNAINYETTEISFYKFVCQDESITSSYVGHTSNFTKRKSQHKFLCNNPSYKHYNYKIYQTIRDNGGWDNWRMIEIDKRLCKDKREAERVEQEWIDLLKTDLNMHKAFRAETPTEYHKQYHLENAETIKQNSSKYYEEHAEEIKERVNQYRLNNPEKIKKWNQRYRIKNAEKIKQYCAENAHKKKEYQKQYYAEYFDKIIEQQRQYCAKNKEKINQYKKQYHTENIDKIREYHKQYYLKKKQEKLVEKLNTRITNINI